MGITSALGCALRGTRNMCVVLLVAGMALVGVLSGSWITWIANAGPKPLGVVSVLTIRCMLGMVETIMCYATILIAVIEEWCLRRPVPNDITRASQFVVLGDVSVPTVYARAADYHFETGGRRESGSVGGYSQRTQRKGDGQVGRQGLMGEIAVLGCCALFWQCTMMGQLALGFAIRNTPHRVPPGQPSLYLTHLNLFPGGTHPMSKVLARVASQCAQWFHSVPIQIVSMFRVTLYPLVFILVAMWTFDKKRAGPPSAVVWVVCFMEAFVVAVELYAGIFHVTSIGRPSLGIAFVAFLGLSGTVFFKKMVGA